MTIVSYIKAWQKWQNPAKHWAPEKLQRDSLLFFWFVLKTTSFWVNEKKRTKIGEIKCPNVQKTERDEMTCCRRSQEPQVNPKNWKIVNPIQVSQLLIFDSLINSLLNDLNLLYYLSIFFSSLIIVLLLCYSLIDSLNVWLYIYDAIHVNSLLEPWVDFA